MRPELKYTSDSDLESVFSTEEPRASGVNPATQKYVCSFAGCGQKFRRMVHLDRHEYKHTGVRRHVCFHEGCTKTYTNITHLKRHIKVFHEKVEKRKDVTCRFDFCDKKFCSVYSMERHIREVHDNPKVYKCTHCDEKFTQKLKLRRHEVKHSGVYPFNCSKCNKGFVQAYFLTRHVCKSYKCEQCEETFEKWSELLAHRKANHKTTYKCDQCNKEFRSKFFLSEHKPIHDEQVFTCPHEDCTRVYSYKRNLYQHLRTAHEGKKFQCTVEGCEADLTTKRALEYHIKTIHTEKAKKPAKSRKERSKRKDAGTKKKSTLAALSGVVLESEVHKMVIEGTAEIEIDLPAIEEEARNDSGREVDDDSDDLPLVILKVK